MNNLKNSLAAGLLSLVATTAAFAQVNITTWQCDLQHSGANLQETTLTPASVKATGGFGLLFVSPNLDGAVLGQPLYVSNLNIAGGTHNVVFVCTERDNIYAIDGDSNTGGNATPLWSRSLLPPGTIYPPQADVNSGDILDALGITSTPVIDLATQTMYVLAKYKISSSGLYGQQLHALDIKTGLEKFGGPVQVNPSFAGSQVDAPEDPSVTVPTGVIPFNPLRSHDRAALVLYNGVVYLSYASHSDTTPYHGECIGYDASTLQLVKTFISTPNAEQAGIWGGGSGPAVDSAGNMYITTGNGAFDQNLSPYTTGTDWGMSFLKLPTTGNFTVSFSNPLNYFTPYNWGPGAGTLNNGDLDIGSSGVTILPDQKGPHTHILVGGGKGGTLYVLDRDAMGGYNATSDHVVQEVTETNSLFVTPAYFNGYLYYAPGGGHLVQRTVGYNAVDGSYVSSTPFASSNFSYGGGSHGAEPFITANGNTNGIVWCLNIANPAQLHAYDATNVSGNPIFTGTATFGGVNYGQSRFAFPMVANGKAYFCANTTTDYQSRLFVFGPPPPASGTPTAPSNAAAVANSASQITVTWTDNSTNESAFTIQRSTSPTGPFTAAIPNANPNDISWTDTGLSPGTTYYYRVVASNNVGTSNPTLVASATTFPSYSQSGLVAYWPLDEGGGSTANDSTGQGHNGTINGETSWTTGFINEGLSLHGTGAAFSNIVVPNTSDLRFSAAQSFTLSAWFNQSAVHTSDEAIIAKSFDQGNGYGILINPSNQLVFRGPGGDLVGSAVTANTWTHVAVVQDGPGNTRKIYVNGALVNTGTAQAGDGAGDFWIAQANPGTGIGEFSFPGIVDEVRVYNRALPASEITSLLSPPVLQSTSSIAHGGIGTFNRVLTPSSVKVIESREGSPAGSYTLVLNFSAPVSGLTATLNLQAGGTAAGTVSGLTYDTTNKVVTVALTGVANAQAMNLHLSGIQPGNGTADIPFNVLWGDVNGDNVVDSLDLNIVQGSRNAALTSANFGYDVNDDGALNAADEALIGGLLGKNIGAQTASNIALFKPTTSTSTLNGNTPDKAVDNNPATSWESSASDSQSLVVNLGTLSTINSFAVNWLTANAKTYTIDVSPDGSAWTTVNSEPNNTTAGTKTYTPAAGTKAAYVRLSGLTRTSSTLGFNAAEFQIFGVPGAGSRGAAPVINSPLTAPAAVGSAFSYQVAATNSPTSYSATGLPNGLAINPSSGVISGTPTTTGPSNVTINAVNAYGIGTATLAISTEATITSVPTVNSPLTATGSLLTPFTYQITGTHLPSGFGATNLPTGLSVNPVTGVITGTSNTTGTFNISVTATNKVGTSTPATLVLTIDGGGNTNLALTGTASANPAAYLAANSPAMAIDNNNTTTRWESTHIDTQSFTVDLGKLCTIHYVIINWEPAAGKIYTVDSSPDNFTWSNIGGETNNTTSGIHTYTAPANTVGRYVRMNGTLRDSTFGYSFWEFQVWGVVGGSTPTSPVITSVLSATGTVGVPFSYQITGTNTPTIFTATPLPPGLSVSSTGLISGTPSGAGPVATTISAGNTGGSDTKTLNITINPGAATLPPSISNTTLTQVGNVGTALTYQVTATNNPASFAASNLPQGLSINSTTGLISGTPLATGSIKSTISATNAKGKGSAYLTFVIGPVGDPNISLNMGAIASTTQQPNLATLANDSDTANTRWAASDGTVPQWWRVDLGGSSIISRVNIKWFTSATRSSKYKIEVSQDDTNYTTAIDRTTNTATGDTSDTPTGSMIGRYVRITISAVSQGFVSINDVAVYGKVLPSAPAITSPLTASVTAGSSFSYQITASNTPSSFGATNLPAGLLLNPTTGIISGIPTTPATTSVGLTATNLGGTSAIANLVLTVNPSANSVLMSAVSRQVHGSAGALDLALPVSGIPATEVRQGTTAGTYSLVLTFSAPVSGATAALALQSGQTGTAVGHVGTLSYSGGSTIITVPLTAVGNAQRLNLHLSGIQPGNSSADIPVNILWDDVNGDGTNNVLDQGQVRTHIGQAVNSTTMSYDLNADGVIDTNDFNAARASSGATLP